MDLLAERPRTTSEVTEALGQSRHLVVQHLGVLREADLVRTVARGRVRMNYFNAVPIREIHDRWVSRYAGSWSDALIGLRDTVEAGGDSEEGRKDVG